MNKIRLLIVDDHAVVRQGLRGFLELLDDFEIVGEGSNGAEAVSLAAALKPDVILLDLIMPEMDGIEATRRIRLADPKARILILSSFSNDDNVLPAIRAGAMGYLLKDIDPDDLAKALRETHQGRSQLHPDIAMKLITHVQQDEPQEDSVSDQLKELTERELDVLRLIARGMSNREIGVALSISHTTVKTHVSNLLSKLDLADRTQAAILAIRLGLTSDE
jgi:NarL family two-component system response regulator LiaR